MNNKPHGYGKYYYVTDQTDVTLTDNELNDTISKRINWYQEILLKETKWFWYIFLFNGAKYEGTWD